MPRASQATTQAPSQPIWEGTRQLPMATASIGAILALIRRKKFFLMIWVVGCALCGVAYAKIMRPDFVATTQILLQPRFVINDGPEDIRHFHQFMIDNEQCETELRVLRSEQLLYRVFKALDIAKSHEIYDRPDGVWAYLGAQVDKITEIVSPDHGSLKAFNAFTGRMRSRRLGLSYVIEISYRANSPQQAVRVVNSIASAYAAYRLRGVLSREQGRGVYREGRLLQLQEQLLAVEAGMRLGTIPDINLTDADVRLLGPADLPLGSLYPKLTPTVMFMVLFGLVTGLLIVIMPHAGPSPVESRSADHPDFRERARIA